MATTSEVDGESLPNDPARRRLLKQAGVGLAVAWTAPVILSSHVPAAAATPLCPDCGKDLIDNGSAATGDFTDWSGLFPTPPAAGAPEVGQYGAVVVPPVLSPTQPAGAGAYFFRGSSASVPGSSISRFNQNYTFPPTCISEFASHQAGTYTVDLSADLGGEDDVPGTGLRSVARVIFTQRAGTTTVASQTLGPFTGAFTNYSVNVPIDPTTTNFRLQVRFDRTSGNGPINAWADNITLRLNC